MSKDKMIAGETEQVMEIAEKWRERLMDISWFMRSLNDKIIRNDFEQPGWP